MVKMLTHRMMDNLSCMLLAKDELQSHLQAQAATQGMEAQQEKMEDSELAKENAQLRIQLLEAAADNDAFSRSLQERVASLADATDSKLKAESEAKVLQVQLKSMQKDMDAHKYELHLLRKQLQIRNDEREHNKKVSDASNKQHLDNVKKIAKLESECQRLRALIRQRLPGPAVIAQMRAECEIHIKTGKKKSLCISTPSRSLPNSSYLHHQREREALTEKLLSVEDEAKFLKEALTKRTSELQEARQLCARTAMKLSSAQDLVEAMSNASVPSSPQPQRNMHFTNSNDAPMQDQEKSACANHVENGGVYVSSMMDREHMMSIDYEEVGSWNNGEEDEVSCAESWASALFAELSHLSNFHENASVGTCEIVRVSNQKDTETSGPIGGAIGFKPDASIQLVQEHDLYSALQKVSQKLSHVGEGILLSSLTSDDDANVGSASFRAHPSDNIVLEGDQNFNILDEISHIKHLLLEVGTVMQMQGKLYNGSVNVINNEHEYINDVISADQAGKISRRCKRERTLSRFHCENEDKLDTKFSDGTKFSSSTSANMEEFGDIIIDCSAEGAKFCGESAKFSAVAITSSDTMEVIDAAGVNFSETAKSGDVTMEQIQSGMIKGTKFSENAMEEGAITVEKFSSSPQLNLARETIEVSSVEDAYVDVHVDLQLLLQAAQAELEFSRGKIATLEGELSRILQEKAVVAQQLSDTCSLRKNLEAELARSLANVEELKIQVAILQAQLADQAEDRISIHQLGGQPFSQVDQICNLKEGQDLAVARAQLADCQRNIHVMRKQMAPNILNSPSQDMITDDSSLFDSLSQSSKSTSPNMSQAANLSPKINNVNPTEQNNIYPMQQEDKSSCYDSNSSTNTNTLQESSNSHHRVKDVQSFEKCKVDHVDEDSESCDLLTRSISKDWEVKLALAKPSKSSTTSRIAEFFNKAKSYKR